MLSNRCVVLGITGGIAVYKVGYLISLLKKSGCHVHVIMTKNACEFVTPKTFEVLTGNPVVLDTFERNQAFDVEHVSLAKAADLFIVAPATANFLAKAARGIADDMLTTTYLAAKCPKIIAPAMNTQMFVDSTVARNIATLQQDGVYVMDVGSGVLACGDVGEGRMREPQEIFEYAVDVFKQANDLAGLKLLITAGPTREYFDPIRYITSPSSGKMGYEIASIAANRGGDVVLISGPVAITPPKNVCFVQVTSAQEMYEECIKRYDGMDIVIKTAAVSDYTPVDVFTTKQKKGEGNISIELTRTKDILLELGKRKQNQVLIGFAAETDNIEAYAREKLCAKNADLICANDVSKPQVGFEFDTNHIVLYPKHADPIDLGFKSKKECAQAIVDKACELYQAKVCSHV